MRIRAEKISKKYNRRSVVKDVSFNLESGESLAITGTNGSGKSTLCKIIAGLIQPSSGTVSLLDGEKELVENERLGKFGIVSPYLQLYRELTPLENATFFANILGLSLDLSRFKALMKEMNIAGREMDKLSTFSSGMLQRMKYVVALYAEPPILILDEPTANLDVEGAQAVYQIMERQRENGILIVATNEPEEIRFGLKHVGLN